MDTHAAHHSLARIYPLHPRSQTAGSDNLR